MKGSFSNFTKYVYVKMIFLKNYLQKFLSKCGKDKENLELSDNFQSHTSQYGLTGLSLKNLK